MEKLLLLLALLSHRWAYSQPVAPSYMGPYGRPFVPPPRRQYAIPSQPWPYRNFPTRPNWPTQPGFPGVRSRPTWTYSPTTSMYRRPSIPNFQTYPPQPSYSPSSRSISPPFMGSSLYIPAQPYMQQRPYPASYLPPMTRSPYMQMTPYMRTPISPQGYVPRPTPPIVQLVPSRPQVPLFAIPPSPLSPPVQPSSPPSVIHIYFDHPNTPGVPIPASRPNTVQIQNVPAYGPTVSYANPSVWPMLPNGAVSPAPVWPPSPPPTPSVWPMLPNGAVSPVPVWPPSPPLTPAPPVLFYGLNRPNSPLVSHILPQPSLPPGSFKLPVLVIHSNPTSAITHKDTSGQTSGSGTPKPSVEASSAQTPTSSDQTPTSSAQTPTTTNFPSYYYDVDKFPIEPIRLIIPSKPNSTEQSDSKEQEKTQAPENNQSSENQSNKGSTEGGQNSAKETTSKDSTTSAESSGSHAEVQNSSGTNGESDQEKTHLNGSKQEEDSMKTGSSEQLNTENLPDLENSESQLDQQTLTGASDSKKEKPEVEVSANEATSQGEESVSQLASLEGESVLQGLLNGSGNGQVSEFETAPEGSTAFGIEGSNLEGSELNANGQSGMVVFSGQDGMMPLQNTDQQSLTEQYGSEMKNGGDGSSSGSSSSWQSSMGPPYWADFGKIA